MFCRLLLVSALIFATISTASAQTARPALPVSPQAAELERKLEAAKAQAVAAQAAVAEIERQLAESQSTALAQVIERASAGDEAAIREVLALADTSSDFIPYDYAKPARSADATTFLRVFGELFPKASPTGKSKYVWMLGVSGTPEAATRLRTILAQETDPTILGNAIFALSRCPFSADDLAAVGRFANDPRLIKDPIGYYPKGWYGPDKEDGPNYEHQPLNLLAKEFIAKHDRKNFATVPGGLIVQPPTIHCAGFVWEIAGDANRNATVSVAYREYGVTEWRQGMPFLRCESWASPDPKYPFEVGQKLAGSLFDLAPNTQYEVKLTQLPQSLT